MRAAPTFIALASALAVAACAPVDPRADGASVTAAPLERQCFNVSQIRNFRQGRADQIFLRVGASDIYELNGAGCREADFAMQLALIPDGIAGSRLCSGDWAQVVVPGATSRAGVCRVRISRQLTPEEVAAIPAHHKP